MFYYTHHRDMYVPQYVSLGAASECPAHYMFHWRSPVSKKKSNITIFKKVENIIKIEL
jgi:hypothetical protein